jgi:predicted membrane-bound mannosyltransferase
MHATKETFVFALVAMAGAAVLTRFWAHGLFREKRGGNEGEGGTGADRPGIGQRWLGCHPTDGRRFPWGHLAAGAGVMLVVSVLLFSSFFTNASGPVDSVRTYLPWLDRARGESPHVHPWHYFVSLLAYNKVGRGPVWSEGLILGLGLVGLVGVMGRRRWAGGDLSWGRFVGFYSVLLLVIYSVIPYKTPWCLVGFWHGFILLAGLGGAMLIEWARWLPFRAIGVALLLAGSAQLGLQAYRAAVPYADSQRNPYVYAQTLESTLNLVERVTDLARVHPQGHDMLIQVMARGGDYWPLPWYFRPFTRTGWWAEVPANPVAPVVIASPAFEPELTKRLGETHQMAGYYGLRPSVFLMLFVERETWRAYLDLEDEE